MTPNSNKQSLNKFDKIQIQTFLEEVDQHQQLVHQEVITLVVEVKHMLMIYDVVDHHCIKRINYIDTQISISNLN